MVFGVVILHTFLEANLQVDIVREELAAEGSNLASLAHGGRQVAGQESALLQGIGLMPDIRQVGLIGEIEDQELLARVSGGSGLSDGSDSTADGYDQAALAAGHVAVEVRLEVCRLL